MQILLIEDDTETAAFVTSALKDDGHAVVLRADGRSGLAAATETGFDLLIVDRMLPALDGLTVVQTLRARKCATPVLFLTTMAGVDDRVTGLRAGADDYLVKPFAMPELLARVHALRRRASGAFTETNLKIADLEIDVMKRTVRRSGCEISLQPREFNLLAYLMRHAGQVVTRSMLLEDVWDYHFDPKTNIVESHLSRLRTKIDKGFGPELITTIRGLGYSLRVP